MFERARIAVVVPAFNVEGHIARVIATMPEDVDEIFVVDDGSTDATATTASSTSPRAETSVRVISHAVNRGVGAAIATGYQHALRSGADVIAVMAGDGQMDPSDLREVLAPVVRNEADYAKGNRLAHPSVLRAMPFARWVGNIVLSALTRWATGLRDVTDSQCGYTAIHRRVLLCLDPSAMWARYGYPNHLLGALSRAKFRIRDVIVRPVYANERSGIRLRDALITIPRILVAIASTRWAERDCQLPARGGFVEIR